MLPRVPPSASPPVITAPSPTTSCHKLTVVSTRCCVALGLCKGLLYRKVMDSFVDWCELNQMQLSISKTKELVVDLKWPQSPINTCQLGERKWRLYRTSTKGCTLTASCTAQRNHLQRIRRVRVDYFCYVDSDPLRSATPRSRCSETIVASAIFYLMTFRESSIWRWQTQRGLTNWLYGWQETGQLENCGWLKNAG